MPLLTQAWVGYDLPFDPIENEPTVRSIRKAGFKKRTKQPEHHVTVSYFPEIELEEVAKAVADAEGAYGNDLTSATFRFDGYGIIKHDKGEYVYLSPDEQSIPGVIFLRNSIKEQLTSAQQSSELHLSIGGPDPFGSAKPKQTTLKQPFTSEGSLVVVGKTDDEEFHKLRWDHASQSFIEEVAAPSQDFSRPDEPPRPIHTIAMFAKIQADTAAAVCLLNLFGEERFPGVSTAKPVFFTALPQDKSPQQYEAEGYLLLDLGGMFDHHLANEQSGKRTECVATLVAKYLGIDTHPALKKVLAWAKRDDLEGKGTVSADSLDRAFGLSGIIMNLNRQYHDDPAYVLDTVSHLIEAHVREEYRRHVELPQEWERLQQEGKAETFLTQQGSAELNSVFLESDNVTLAGFLKAAHKVDLVIQRASTGHTNIVTQQLRSLDLRPVVAELRLAEVEKNGGPKKIPRDILEATGSVDAIPEWYYDDAANTIQNGGVHPEGIPATKLSKEEIIAIVRETLPRGVIGSLKRKKANERG